MDSVRVQHMAVNARRRQIALDPGHMNGNASVRRRKRADKQDLHILAPASTSL